ncbi:hypothetical protein JCM9279_007336 [Rhodotorula babjevae]
MLRRLCALALAAAAGALASPGALASAHEPRYDHSSLGASSSDDGPAGDAQRYGRLIALHAVLGFLAFQVVAPLAVVIAAVGKSWGDLWFRAHWRMQLFFVGPATVVSVLVAALAANGESGAGEVDLKHKITGYVLLGALSVQALLGFYSHHRQVVVERFSAETGRELPVAKRRLSNWMHMALGVALLTVGGLEVTWGFGLYEESVGEKVPTWVVVVHWVVAGLPVLIVTPFVLIRGILRLRRGASFSDAFITPFHSSSSSLTSTSSSYNPPRKLFLNSATYLATPVFDVDLENDKADGVGHAYEHGKGVDGRVRVESVVSAWPGAETRDEYEAEVASSRAPDSVAGGAPSAASFRSFTTLGNDYPRADGGDAEGAGLLRGDSTWRPSRVAPGAMALYDAVPATYPPAPAAVADSGSTTPSLPALPPIFAPASSPAPAAARTLSTPTVLPGPPAASAIASPLSPRLSFMPFAGPAPAHPPATSSSPAPTSLTVSSATSVDARGEVAAAPVLVPHEARDRHDSFAGEVVDAARPRRDRLLPLPGEPGSPSSLASSRAAVENGGGAQAPSEEAVEEDEEEDGAGVGDDSESTRLMDELERELTISTVRSGRSARSVAPAAAAAVEDEAQEGAAVEQEQEQEDEQTRLEREQSGKWLGSNRLSSSS